MHVRLGQLNVYFPSASDPSFWLGDDLAEWMGVDFNAEAAMGDSLAAHGAASFGGFGGFLDMFFHASDAAALTSAVDQAALELEIPDDVLISCYPPFDFDCRAILAERPFSAGTV